MFLLFKQGMICEYSDFCSWITSFQRMRMPTNASLPMLMLTAHMSFHWQWLKVCMNLVGVYDNVYTLCVAGQLIFSPGPCGIFSYKAYFSPCVREASVSGHLSTLTLMLSRSSCMDTFIFCELVKKIKFCEIISKHQHRGSRPSPVPSWLRQI